jgi:hypothetical protein
MCLFHRVSPCPCKRVALSHGSNICFGLVGIGHHLELRVILILHPKKLASLMKLYTVLKKM